MRRREFIGLFSGAAALPLAARDGDKAEQLARAHIREALRCRLKLLQKE